MRGKNATDVRCYGGGWLGRRARGGGGGGRYHRRSPYHNTNGWSFLVLSPKKFLACNHVTIGTLSRQDEFVDDDERRRVRSGSRTSSKAGKTSV